MSNIKTELIEAINALGRAVNKVMFEPNGIDIGDVIFLVHRHRNAYGYCYTEDNWKYEVEGVPIRKMREIALTPEGLNQSLESIIDTMAHELVHASNGVDGIKDCSGRRHNLKFKARCDTVGLPVEKHDKLGWITDESLWDAERFKEITKLLSEEELGTLNLISAHIPLPKEKKNRNLSVFQCPYCDVKARAKPSANLICGDCEVPMGKSE